EERSLADAEPLLDERDRDAVDPENLSVLVSERLAVHRDLGVRDLGGLFPLRNEHAQTADARRQTGRPQVIDDNETLARRRDELVVDPDPLVFAERRVRDDPLSIDRV